VVDAQKPLRTILLPDIDVDTAAVPLMDTMLPLTLVWTNCPDRPIISPESPSTEPDPRATKLPDTLVVTAPAMVAVPDILTTLPDTLVDIALPETEVWTNCPDIPIMSPDNPNTEPLPRATKLPEILVVTAPAIVAVPDILIIFPEMDVLTALPDMVTTGVRTPEFATGIGTHFRPE